MAASGACCFTASVSGAEIRWQTDPTYVTGDMVGTAANGSDWVQVPEPGTLALFGLGLLMIGARRCRRS